MYIGEFKKLIGKWWRSYAPAIDRITRSFYVLDIVQTSSTFFEIYVVDSDGFKETYHRNRIWLRSHVVDPGNRKELNREFIKNWFKQQG